MKTTEKTAETGGQKTFAKNPCATELEPTEQPTQPAETEPKKLNGNGEDHAIDLYGPMPDGGMSAAALYDLLNDPDKKAQLPPAPPVLVKRLERQQRESERRMTLRIVDADDEAETPQADELSRAIEECLPMDVFTLELIKPRLTRKFKISGRAIDRLIDQMRRRAAKPFPSVPKFADLRLTQEECAAARIAPRCIVENYLYADLGLESAPGSTGKTTINIYEAVHIILGRPLWGLRVLNPGPVIFITAEDTREISAARLREIMDALQLTDEEREKVYANFLIWDVTGQTCRLVESDERGNISLTGLADEIIEGAQDINPAMIIIDPSISFGAGEHFVNSNEQGLVLAGRRIIRALDCCVRYICHTGQSAALAERIDQYASRGGTALPDGARMVAVLCGWKPRETNKLTPPPGFTVAAKEQVIILALPKISYSAPQEHIWIKRDGYGFEYARGISRNPEAEAKACADQVENFLVYELKNSGVRYSENTLKALSVSKLGMNPKTLRCALAELESQGRIMPQAPVPEIDRRGKRGGPRTYIHPTKLPFASSGPENEANSKMADSDTTEGIASHGLLASSPIREKEANEANVCSSSHAPFASRKKQNEAKRSKRSKRGKDT